MNNNFNVAYFITPHGFGHGTRSAAIMDGICAINPLVQFEIFTHIPQVLFKQSLSFPFAYHPLLTDIGIVQNGPLVEDIAGTLSRLNEFLPFNNSLIIKLTKYLRKRNCKLIICDIAPIGIAVARELGTPSVLVENFTWDWIYKDYVKYDNDFNKHIKYLSKVFQSADYRIQTEPVCCSADYDLIVGPISRKISKSKEAIRNELCLLHDDKVILITLGGIDGDYKFLEKLSLSNNFKFIIPGASKKMEQNENLILLPKHSTFFHPDLINASNAVVGKAGYSTTAEVYNVGLPFGFVTRENFKESAIIEKYINNHMKGFAIKESEFYNCSWLPKVDNLLSYPRINHRKGKENINKVARFLHDLITQ